MIRPGSICSHSMPWPFRLVDGRAFVVSAETARAGSTSPTTGSTAPGRPRTTRASPVSACWIRHRHRLGQSAVRRQRRCHVSPGAVGELHDPPRTRRYTEAVGVVAETGPSRRPGPAGSGSPRAGCRSGHRGRGADRRTVPGREWRRARGLLPLACVPPLDDRARH